MSNKSKLVTAAIAALIVLAAGSVVGSIVLAQTSSPGVVSENILNNAAPVTQSETTSQAPVPFVDGLELISQAPAADGDDASVNGVNGGSNEATTATVNKAGATIDLDSLKLVNNQWGAPADEKLTCAVYHNQSKNFGWYWNRQEPKTKPGIEGVLPIYPGLRIGGNPWEQSNSAYFPIRVSALESLTFQVTYNYPAVPTGAFDLAYDIFFTDTNKSRPDPEIKAEVMIWLQGTIEQPQATFKGDYTDRLNTYALFSHVMSSGRLYYAFVMKGQYQFQAQHTVDVKKLLGNLDLNPNWYIPGVELGSEVVNGSGKIEINQFSIKMNNSVIEQ
jgi:hypothetical protein